MLAYACVCLYAAATDSGWNQGGGGVIGLGVADGGGGVELPEAAACIAWILVCAWWRCIMQESSAYHWLRKRSAVSLGFGDGKVCAVMCAMVLSRFMEVVVRRPCNSITKGMKSWAGEVRQNLASAVLCFWLSTCAALLPSACA